MHACWEEVRRRKVCACVLGRGEEREGECMCAGKRRGEG